MRFAFPLVTDGFCEPLENNYLPAVFKPPLLSDGFQTPVISSDLKTSVISGGFENPRYF